MKHMVLGVCCSEIGVKSPADREGCRGLQLVSQAVVFTPTFRPHNNRIITKWGTVSGQPPTVATAFTPR